MNPECDCATKAPTYPVARTEPHLPDCVWWHVIRLQKDLEVLQMYVNSIKQRTHEPVTTFEIAGEATD